jgi:hypothetical protein
MRGVEVVQPKISDKIRHWFNWLFDEYGFALATERQFDSFGNWVVVLQSDKCGRIRIIQDRGEVFLALGPQWSPVSWDAGPWYSLDVVVRYLSDGDDRFDPALGEIEQQMERLAEKLQCNISAACGLFRSDAFWEKKDELDALQQMIEDEVWKRLLG